MKKEDLLSAIGQADEKYIKHADSVFTGDKNENKSRIMTAVKAVASVAAAVLIIGSVWFISMRYAVKDPDSPVTTGNGPAAPSDTLASIRASLDEYMKNKKTGKSNAEACGVYGDYYVQSCVTCGEGENVRYLAFVYEPDTDTTDNLWTESVGGVILNYGSGRTITVISNGKLYGSISEAYDDRAIVKSDVEAAAKELLGMRFVIHEQVDADAPADEKIINSILLREYSATGDSDIYYHCRLGNNLYAALMHGDESPAAVIGCETVAGLPFYHSDPGTEFLIAKADDSPALYRGLQNAYDAGAIGYNDLISLLFEYSRSSEFSYLYSEDIIDGILYTSCREYLDGHKTMYEHLIPDANSGITYYNYVKIGFCHDLGDGRYAAIYSLLFEPEQESYERKVPIGGYEFTFYNGRSIRIVNVGGVCPLADAELSDEQLNGLYNAYLEFAGPYPGESNELIAVKKYLKSKEAGMYNHFEVSFAVQSGDVFIAFIDRPKTEYTADVWEEKVAGYTFPHNNGQQFKVLRGQTVTTGLTAAYDSGILSDKDVAALAAALGIKPDPTE